MSLLSPIHTKEDKIVKDEDLGKKITEVNFGDPDSLKRYLMCVWFNVQTFFFFFGCQKNVIHF